MAGMTVETDAGTHRPDMGSSADTMAADMRAAADAQYVYPGSDAVGQGTTRTKKGQRKKCCRQRFHDDPSKTDTSVAIDNRLHSTKTDDPPFGFPQGLCKSIGPGTCLQVKVRIVLAVRRRHQDVRF